MKLSSGMKEHKTRRMRDGRRERNAQKLCDSVYELRPLFIRKRW
jgi:hypothetical protein